MEKPFLFLLRMSHRVLPQHNKKINHFLFFSKKYHFLVLFRKEDWGRTHRTLFEDILFPFSLNKCIKQLKFCPVITASVTTCPQKCSVNLPPQDQYPCCRCPLRCIHMPAHLFFTEAPIWLSAKQTF